MKSPDSDYITMLMVENISNVSSTNLIENVYMIGESSNQSYDLSFDPDRNITKGYPSTKIRSIMK